MHFGHPTEEQREAFTRVLQGHVRVHVVFRYVKEGVNCAALHLTQIAIDTAIFPEGTNGMQLDVLARRALWQDGYVLA